MFLGASLNPQYFKEKVNVYIALAPVASTAHITGFLKFVAHDVDNMIATLVDQEGLYSWFPQFSESSVAIDSFCALAKNLCEEFGNKLVDETVDNVPRFEMAVPSTPSGQTYRAMVYYSQAILTGKFTLYDYGPEKNLELYGTEEPPLVPLEDYDIPTVLLSGDLD